MCLWGAIAIMSFQRLTLLPQPVSAGTEREIPDIAALAPVEVTSIARLAQGGRWQTEAMRSYSRPVLLWVTRGQGKITVAGRSSGYGTHNAIFLPPGTQHGFSVMGQVMGSLVHLPRDQGLEWPARPVHLRLLEAQLQRELTGMIDALEREAQVRDAQTPAALSFQAGLLSVWLKRAVDAHDQRAPAPKQSSAHKLTEAFTALVERDFRRPVGVQHFAALLGVTPTHLSRVCRQVSGRAALDLIKDRRHFEARRLLRDSDLKVADIARRTGFASPAYFTRAFVAYTGQSPSVFRRAG